MDNQFEVLDISGDVGLKVYGHNLEEVFINGGVGLYNLITNISNINPRNTIDIKVYSESLDELFVGWLNELIFQFDTYGFIGSEIKVETLNENRIEAWIRGEEFNPDIHEKGLLIKAATYHDLIFEKKDGIWVVEVIFDL